MSLEKYLMLNPFVKDRIDDQDIWGNNDNFLDVASVNKDVLDRFYEDIQTCITKMF